MTSSIREIAAAARQASVVAAQLDGETKRRVLEAIADEVEKQADHLKAENARDLEAAAANGLSGAPLERLALSDKTLAGMVGSLREVAGQADPVGEITEMKRRPNGLLVGRMQIPLGVIGVIYESRPNVTTDAAALCLKAGNAVILRGGSEAIHSNRALGETMANVFSRFGLPEAIVSVVPTADRESVSEMLKLDEFIDLIIPRGGESLIRFVAENSRIPVIKHYKGVCHVYIDAEADPKLATDIVVNAKAQRPGVCNAAETLLIHHDAIEECLLPIAVALVNAGVEMRVCPRTREALAARNFPQTKIRAAKVEDYGAEFLDLILAVKVVDSFEQAIEHIRAHGSDHTESIVTNNHRTAMRFIREINSSVVVVNASTRFADGQQLGLGAEIGISTTKLHSYGPMGAEELTTRKFVVLGDGQIRQ
jgi:glutamate-5-semialdehyde dehydrogenase